MPKTILITGSTDGIGLATAKSLRSLGHHVLLHGRNADKLAQASKALKALPGDAQVEAFVADISTLAGAEHLAQQLIDTQDKLDILINNAGVLRAPTPITADGFDVRFAVNTLAPYLLTQRLLPLMHKQSRVVNLSSAAQSPVSIPALRGQKTLNDMDAYAQSKLAITIWSRELAETLSDQGPLIIAVNPGSLLGSKMVKEGFGVAGGDLQIGADILCKAALDEQFATASGLYYDNDSRQFADPHSDALIPEKAAAVMATIEEIIAAHPLARP